MKSLKKFYYILLFTVFGCNCMAQTIEVSAKIDSSTMMIGEQRIISLEVTQPNNASVRFPIIGQTDTLVSGIEILAISKLDTTKTSQARVIVKQSILITSFDTGRYVIPAFIFETKVKKYETEKVFLNVNTIEEDFLNAKITDIKQNYSTGVNWTRLFLYLSIILIIDGFVIIGYFVYKYYERKKKENGKPIEVIDQRLPHEIALEELNEIKEKKVWKQGLTKQYYTNITDTLREYFVKRFKISALEMTSTEIIDALKYNNEASSILENMKQVFYTSDMVKFAKQEPTQEENEMSILNAYRIVNETTITPIQEETKKEDETLNTK